MALLARLPRLALIRSQAVTVITKRLKNLSSRELEIQLLKIRHEAADILQSPACRDILSRTRVVTETSDCVWEVERLMATGGPLGLDCEGVSLSDKMTSLIQISDPEGKITMFRTGVNPDLFSRGGLADILQSQQILKIIHASSVDCLSLYKDDVKLWNIFDTAGQLELTLSSFLLIFFFSRLQGFGLPKEGQKLPHSPEYQLQ